MNSPSLAAVTGITLQLVAYESLLLLEEATAAKFQAPAIHGSHDRVYVVTDATVGVSLAVTEDYPEISIGVELDGHEHWTSFKVHGERGGGLDAFSDRYLLPLVTSLANRLIPINEASYVE